LTPSRIADWDRLLTEATVFCVVIRKGWRVVSIGLRTQALDPGHGRR
jgi:hypothetical protein